MNAMNMNLLWYYGLSNCLHEEVKKSIPRYKKKYEHSPTHIWFKTGTVVDAKDVHGLEIRYKMYILSGHFEVGIETGEMNGKNS